jgi:hypothetical protein
VKSAVKGKAGERAAFASKLRRDGRHCPVCLAPLPRIARMRPAQKCLACKAEPVPEARCSGCDEGTVWASRTAAGCSSCARHGSRVAMIAGHAWLSRDED